MARERFRLVGTLRYVGGEVFANSQADRDLLGAEAVLIELSPPTIFTYGVGGPCELPPFFGNVPGGVYTIKLRAIAGPTTVAVAPEILDVAIDGESLTDLGTVVLTPCGTSCPP